MLMATSPSDGTANGTPSLTTLAPARTITFGWPPNVSVRSDAGTMLAPLVRKATCAASITSGLSPYSFDRRMRNRSPPTVVWTICRIVVFAQVGTGSRVPAAGRGAVELCAGAQVGHHSGARVGAAGETAGCR